MNFHICRLNGNDVNMTLALPKLDIKGEFEVKYAPFSKKFGVDLHLGEFFSAFEADVVMCAYNL